VGLSEVGAYHDPNLASAATATASSYYDSRYVPAKAIDGIVGVSGSGEWASKGTLTLNPDLTLTWPTAQNINTVTFYDRPNTTDWAPGGTLTFSDGPSVAVSGIPNNGAPINVTFPDRSVTWVKFTVSGGSGSNVGLSEMKVLHQ
jgi:hypothetical protein